MKFDLEDIQKKMDDLPKRPEEYKPQPQGLPRSRREQAEDAKKREIKKMRKLLEE